MNNQEFIRELMGDELIEKAISRKERNSNGELKTKGKKRRT